jgi:hypothetical protein
VSLSVHTVNRRGHLRVIRGLVEEVAAAWLADNPNWHIWKAPDRLCGGVPAWIASDGTTEVVSCGLALLVKDLRDGAEGVPVGGAALRGHAAPPAPPGTDPPDIIA